MSLSIFCVRTYAYEDQYDTLCEYLLCEEIRIGDLRKGRPSVCIFCARTYAYGESHLGARSYQCSVRGNAATAGQATFVTIPFMASLTYHAHSFRKRRDFVYDEAVCIKLDLPCNSDERANRNANLTTASVQCARRRQ